MAKALTAILAVSLAACEKSSDDPPPSAPGSMGDTSENTVVPARIKSVLMANPKINGDDFKVETRKGEVLLSGFVDTQKQLDLALDTLHAVRGVGSVQNHAVLKRTNATLGNTVDDGLITTRVNATLLADPSVHSLNVRVVRRIDAVQLSGFVDNPTQVDRAMALARGTLGVRQVANHMAMRE